MDGNLPLGLVADVDGDLVASHADDATGTTSPGLTASQALLKERGKILFGAGRARPLRVTDSLGYPLGDVDCCATAYPRLVPALARAPCARICHQLRFMRRPRTALDGFARGVDQRRVGRRPQRRVARTCRARRARSISPGERCDVGRLAAPASSGARRRARSPALAIEKDLHRRHSGTRRCRCRALPSPRHRPHPCARCSATRRSRTTGTRGHSATPARRPRRCGSRCETSRAVDDACRPPSAHEAPTAGRSHSAASACAIVQGDAAAVVRARRRHDTSRPCRRSYSRGARPGAGSTVLFPAPAGPSMATTIRRSSTLDRRAESGEAREESRERSRHARRIVDARRRARRRVPTTANAMAMRWSSQASTRPPCSGLPSRPRSTNPSAVTRISAPSVPSCASAARRSLSLTRSSATPRMRISPSAKRRHGRSSTSSMAVGDHSCRRRSCHAGATPARADRRAARPPRHARPPDADVGSHATQDLGAPIRVGCSPTPHAHLRAPYQHAANSSERRRGSDRPAPGPRTPAALPAGTGPP